MKTCNYCGVELEENMNFCPLCGEPVIENHINQHELIRIKKQDHQKKFLSDYQKLSGSEKRKIFREVAGIVFLSAMLFPFLIDFIVDTTISWSWYSIAVCAVLLANTTMASFWLKQPALLLLGSFISTSGLLVFLDILHGSIGWGVKLGIPLLFAAYLIIYGLILIVKHARKKGLNIIAFFVIALGLLSMVTEGIISLYIHNHLELYWSIIVVASVLPIAAFLFFIYYRLKKGTDLKKFFHV